MTRRSPRALVLSCLVLLVAAGCRSAGGKPPSTTPGPMADVGRSLVGQKRILRFHGLKRNLTLDLAEASRASGGCDVAVDVKAATVSGGRGHFSLEIIGMPRSETPSRPSREKAPCRDLPALTALDLTGLSGESSEKVTAEIARVLLTPEAFLKTRGVTFDRPAGPDPREVADATLTARPEEQSLARAVTVPHRRLLAVDPVQRVAKRKVRYEGQIEFVAVLGTDGRLRKPRIATSLGDYEERLVAVLPLWRYEPARRGDEPVASRITDKTVLKIR